MNLKNVDMSNKKKRNSDMRTTGTAGNDMLS
jgi:hypothetical protein